MKFFKSFNLFLLTCLISTTFGFGMQTQQQSKKAESKSATIAHTHQNLSSLPPHQTRFVLDLNANDSGGSQKPNTFPTAGLIKLQGNQPPALPLATRQEQHLNVTKQNLIGLTDSKPKTFEVLTKANLEKIKNLSPIETINQKNIYEKDLAKTVNAHTKLLSQIHPETKAMLDHEIKTNTQHAAETMEKRVLSNDARINCYEEAHAVKEVQLAIEVYQQMIKDCDQRIENFKSEIILEIKPIVDTISTEALVAHEIPLLEKELHKISLMIQKYEKDPIVLAKCRDVYFKLMTQRTYLEKVVQFRQAQHKFDQLKDLQVLFAGFTAQCGQLSAQDQKIVDAGLKAITEQGNAQYQIQTKLTQEAKDWLAKCGISSEQFQNLTYFDALQAHIGNEIITSINEIAKSESHAVFDIETKEFIGMTRDTLALASEANFGGNPIEAVALLKIATTFDQATKNALSAKTAQEAVNTKSNSELRFDVTNLQQAFIMLAEGAHKLNDEAKISLKQAYEAFDNLPPQEKAQHLMEVTAFALLAGQTAAGGFILKTVIKHAVRILPMVYAKEILQHMGQVVAKVNPKTVGQVATSTGQKVNVGSGSGSAAVAKKVEWTPHGFKHVPKKHLSWKETVKETGEGGDAKYKHDVNIEALERFAWENGTPTNDGRPWKVMKFEKIIGAKNGIETNYMRVEMTSNTIHGHPITPKEYTKYTK